MKPTVSSIIDEVKEVLKAAHKGRGRIPRGLSSFQVLERLKARDELIKELGMPGKGEGNHYNAATLVAQACMKLYDGGDVKLRYVDSDGMFFQVSGKQIEAGYGVCAFFQYSGK